MDLAPIRKGKAAEQDTSPPAALLDYQGIQTKRTGIARLMNEPFFLSAVEGTYIRMAIGKLDDENLYRMCEVIDVTQGHRSITLPDGAGSTDKRFTVVVGTATKVNIKFTEISNTRFTQHELDTNLEEIAKSRNHKALTKDQAKAIKKRVSEVVHNRVYTKDERDAMVIKRSGEGKLSHTTFEQAKQNIDDAIAEEMEKGEDADKLRLKKLAMEKESIEINREKIGIKLERKNEAKSTINKRNRAQHAEKDRKAGFLSKRNAEAAKMNTVNDPFIRRQTRPDNLWTKSGRSNKKPEPSAESANEQQKDKATDGSAQRQQGSSALIYIGKFRIYRI